jgi:hypothetical protein
MGLVIRPHGGVCITHTLTLGQMTCHYPSAVST